MVIIILIGAFILSQMYAIVLAITGIEWILCQQIFIQLMMAKIKLRNNRGTFERSRADA